MIHLVHSKNHKPLYAGLDIGTSGVRCTVIDGLSNIIEESRIAFSHSDNLSAMDWWDSVKHCLMQLSPEVRVNIQVLSIDGTSGSVVLTDNVGQPLTIPLMYNDARALTQAKEIARHAPESSIANGVNTSLARALWLFQEYNLAPQACLIVHQADFVIGKLTGLFNRTDDNNALKMGYDSTSRSWPVWLSALGFDLAALPRVNLPGEFVAHILVTISDDLGLSPSLSVLTGTTDSIAAFNATQTRETGIGVTSLGSTLVVKTITNEPIIDIRRGVYSHRFNQQWLVGGASNCGARILREYFTDVELATLSQQMDTSQRLGYGYYPLTSRGERFPILDPNKQPRIQPRPEKDHLFLQGLFESLAEIEKTAYKTLYELGAPKLQKIITVGGGAINAQWTEIRSNIIGAPIESAKNSEASYGMALLSLRHHKKQ